MSQTKCEYCDGKGGGYDGPAIDPADWTCHLCRGTGVVEMNANRRVPTAADVERWGEWWWYENKLSHRFVYQLVISERTGEVMKRAGQSLHRPGEYAGTWLGPVNPEPLPWPA